MPMLLIPVSRPGPLDSEKGSLTPAYGNGMFRNFNFKVGEKRRFANGRDALWNGHFRQLIVSKRTFTNGCHTVRDTHLRQFVLQKRLFANGCHALWNGHFRQLVVVKRTIPIRTLFVILRDDTCFLPTATSQMVFTLFGILTDLNWLS